MFARTPRLLLRPGFPEDAPALAAAIADQAIGRNLANVPWPYSMRDAVEKYVDLLLSAIGVRTTAPERRLVDHQ